MLLDLSRDQLLVAKNYNDRGTTSLLPLEAKSFQLHQDEPHASQDPMSIAPASHAEPTKGLSVMRITYSGPTREILSIFRRRGDATPCQRL